MDSRIHVLWYSGLQNKIGHFFKMICSFCAGDAAYPNSRYLVTPFRDSGHLSQEQKYFNRKISSCRQVVERAIGILKGRFRRLKYIYCHDHCDVMMYITASCVLHNMCISNNDIFEDELPLDNDPNNCVARAEPVRVRRRQPLRRDALIQ